jgi:hypothetical protein
VSNVLALFRREFDQFWGPRMEDAFRFALLTLYEANEAICRDDPVAGRDQQLTVLQVPTVLGSPGFRRRLLPLVRDPLIGAWWRTYFDRLDRKFALEIINPVQTKVSRFAGSAAARAVVGQPRSTIDPAAWVRQGAVVVVNTARGAVGEDTAALVGGCLINLVGLLIGEQAALPAHARQRVTVVVDEFHTMPGADYEGIVAELAKYGASLVLATQSLARLETIDPQGGHGGRALRSTLFSNLDGLFAFHTSAEDARYLVPELGEGVDEGDLLELGEYHCYAKLSSRGERLPVFSVRLDPPPASDPVLAAALAAESARRYGRDRAAVEATLAALLERVAPPPPPPPADGAAPTDAAAPPAPDPPPTVSETAAPGPAPAGPAPAGPTRPASARSRGRPRRAARPPETAPHQGSDAG